MKVGFDSELLGRADGETRGSRETSREQIATLALILLAGAGLIYGVYAATGVGILLWASAATGMLAILGGVWLPMDAWAESEHALHGEWNKLVEHRIAELKAGRTLVVDQLPIDFHPERDEKVLSVTPCLRFQVKPVVNRHTDDFLEPKGRGHLVITDERLVFSAAQPDSDWVERWEFVDGWGVGKSVMTLDCSNGGPMVFEFDSATKRDPELVDGDARCLSLIMDKASRGH